MTVDSIIARARQRRRDLFRGAGRVERPSGTGTLDPVTGVFTPDPPTLVYEGDWNLRIQKWQGSDVEAGGTELRLHEVNVLLPVDIAVEKDDVLIATASTYDSSLVGLSFRVTDVLRDDWQTVRQLLVQEVT